MTPPRLRNGAGTGGLPKVGDMRELDACARRSGTIGYRMGKTGVFGIGRYGLSTIPPSPVLAMGRMRDRCSWAGVRGEKSGFGEGRGLQSRSIWIQWWSSDNDGVAQRRPWPLRSKSISRLLGGTPPHWGPDRRET